MVTWARLSRQQPAWVGQALRWAGVVLLVGAGCLWLQEWLSARSMQRATATVEQMETRQDANGDVEYYPHFRFRLPGGRIAISVPASGSDSVEFAAGEQVPVLYRAERPEETRVGTRKVVYFRAIACGVTGTVLFDLGALLWIGQRRREILAASAAA